jgi:hypothetical protein
MSTTAGSETTTIAIIISAGAGFLGGILCGLLSGAYQHLRDLYYGPQLRIDYENTEASKVNSCHKDRDGKDVEEIYIRARVKNIGRLYPAKSCRVFLTAITEVHPSGKTTPTVFHDPMPLAWPLNDFEPRDMPVDIPFYVNVMSVSKSEAGWMFAVKQMFASHAPLKGYKGTYRLQLTITADNAKPAKREIDVTYMGDWHGLRAVAVS